MALLLPFLQALPMHTRQVRLVFCYLHCWQWAGTDKVLLSNWLFLQVLFTLGLYKAESGQTWDISQQHAEAVLVTGGAVPYGVTLLLCWPNRSQFLGFPESLRVHMGKWQYGTEWNEPIQFPFLTAVMLFRVGMKKQRLSCSKFWIVSLPPSDVLLFHMRSIYSYLWWHMAYTLVTRGNQFSSCHCSSSTLTKYIYFSYNHLQRDT